MYYDAIGDAAPNFSPEYVRTVFKLYGRAVRGIGNTELDRELVALFDGPKVRGGFLWVKKLRQKMKKAGLVT